MLFSWFQPLVLALAPVWPWLLQPSPAIGIYGNSKQVPAAEAFSYRVEWRLIHAGNARLNWTAAPSGGGWHSKLELESVGLVSRLYKVNNVYSSMANREL